MINKPQEFTSFDVVAVCRRLCCTKKIGHTGTLDPMATGVLVLLTGSSTKALSHIPDKSKSYTAEFAVGIETDTGDIWGEVTSCRDAHVTGNEVSAVLPRFRGDILQTPPMFSAVRINGKRLYQLAREGKTVERQKRAVHIDRLELAGSDEAAGRFILKIECSAGTYIRSVITDIGEALGCGATMTALCRTAACGFGIADALTLDEAKALSEKGELEQRLIPVDRAFAEYGELVLDGKDSFRFLNGAAIEDKGQRTEPVRVYDGKGLFLGLAKPDGAGFLRHMYLDIRGN